MRKIGILVGGLILMASIGEITMMLAHVSAPNTGPAIQPAAQLAASP